MEENVFYIEETSNRPPPHGNNCNGHKNAIRAGGKGHWVGDSCGCDGGGVSPSVPIDNIIYPLLFTAIIILIAIKNKIR